ncbi:NUDIX hydrolase [Salinisphaera dokdonensis CL-ES53]|uniref:NUDIX hydrolase n=1 Tax=Salinisphaera dokdonensis CL-ES53 TaxID=1304272 RepID=A0ABV2AZM3_9GAMM
MSREVVVREAATTVLLRDAAQRGPDQLEVLLLRRHASHVFGANAYVFPGGAIDEADSDTALAARCISGTEQAATAGGSVGLAASMAAIRECFEEAGLLVGCVARGDESQRDALRVALNDQTRAWADVAAVLDLRFTLDDLRYFAHWTTPAGPPKRYSTRFFAAAAPDGEALCDGHETTHVWWASPAEAVTAHDRGEITLMTPTRATLETLRNYDNVDDALAGLVETAAALRA